ncbi:MAG: DUF4126 domain-containing protein [Candidatus Thermoplasmatota archaeon]|nr:DUF4126 domain-containing protein [Candidatus Thermoplasmatota archaeon]MED5274113.1 DUF4126 domain-containing protein [Candidatus Thermoplasmatota archaeon]
MDEAGIVIAAFMGISLAAASGFRVFLPPFIMSLAVRVDFIEIDLVGSQFEFFTSTPAIIILGIATVAEFAAYYAPWIDSLLDTIATPAAVLAGIGVTAISLEGSEPIVQWAIAVIAGGGMSATIQTATVATRGISSTFTLGFANPVVATSENIASVVLTIIAILFPILAIVFALLLALLLLRLRITKNRETTATD